jgi:hypothetical protein
MREGTLVGTPRQTRQGLVCPTESRPGALECSCALRPPRGLPIAGLTILQACDLCREITRCQGGMPLQTPEGRRHHPSRSAGSPTRRWSGPRPGRGVL